MCLPRCAKANQLLENRTTEPFSEMVAEERGIRAMASQTPKGGNMLFDPPPPKHYAGPFKTRRTFCARSAQ